MERVSSETVETVRATLAQAGRLDRPKLELPDDLDADEGVVRLDLDGREAHARVERDFDDALEVRVVRDNARQAREGEGDGDDRLAAWADDHGLDYGRTVLLDLVDPDEGHYGLRAPGDSAVYGVPESADDSLSSIAEEVGE